MFDDLADRLRILTESRRLDHLLAKADMRQPEPAPDQEAIAECVLHLVGLGARPDVEILRLAPHQQVAHAPADEIRRVTEPGESIEDFQGVRVNVLAGNAVIRSFVDDRSFSLLFQKPKHLKIYYINFGPYPARGPS